MLAILVPSASDDGPADLVVCKLAIGAVDEVEADLLVPWRCCLGRGDRGHRGKHCAEGKQQLLEEYWFHDGPGVWMPMRHAGGLVAT
jgi:hypothetical protein